MSATTAASEKRSELVLQDKWDLCLANGLVKAGWGLGTGVVLSVLLFKRRPWPVFAGLGFGLGRGYADCDRVFNPLLIPYTEIKEGK